MFASFVPEALEILGKRQMYNGHYDKPLGIRYYRLSLCEVHISQIITDGFRFRHIVVCGHICYESVQNFLRDFLHEDRENQNVKCLFIDG
jgi:potassium large conductance calcium-activated channel subfamily M alpha protein 1